MEALGELAERLLGGRVPRSAPGTPLQPTATAGNDDEELDAADYVPPDRPEQRLDPDGDEEAEEEGRRTLTRTERGRGGGR